MRTTTETKKRKHSNPVREDKCPICEKQRTIYDNGTAHCFNCGNDFDVGMKKFPP